jgi:thiol-disulfide isomerase/thioredoxin
MQRLLSGLVFLTLAAFPLRAEDRQPAQPKPTRAAEELKALNEEYDAALRRFFKVRNDLAEKRRATKDEAERKELDKKLEQWRVSFAVARPITKFGPRLLEFSRRNAEDPAGVDALYVVLREEYRISDTSDAFTNKNSLWAKAIAVLQTKYVGSPALSRLLPLLAFSGEDAAEKFVRTVLEKNPDRLTQARAAKALLNASERFASGAAQMQDDQEMRKKFESKYGKEHVAKWLAKGEKAKRDRKDLAALIKEKFSDLVPDLSVGKKAPELISQDVDGKKVKLSDLKGKVVVLDVWATWCGPCRAMIPDERKLVGKLKDKPFVLVSISVDRDKETLKKFLAKEPMPWTHWWNGPEGGIVEAWSVTYFPTIYVIDAKGIIRHKDHNGEFPAQKLEAAVNSLLEEIVKADRPHE